MKKAKRSFPRRRTRRQTGLESMEDRRMLAVGDLLQTVLPDGELPQADTRFGHSVAINSAYAFVSAPYLDDGVYESIGSVYAYSTQTNELVATIANPTPDAKVFGNAMAASDDYLVVASRQGEQAHVYDIAAGFAEPLLTIQNLLEAYSGEFAADLAISGQYIVLGDPSEDTGASNAGSAYVYDLQAADPAVPMLTLHNPTPQSEEYFGSAVSISGTKIVVGTPVDDSQAPYAGSAYVYDLNSPTPTVPMHMLLSPAPDVGDTFGATVSLEGSYVVVGAPEKASGFDYEVGAAYVYDLASPTPEAAIVTLNNPNFPPERQFGYSVAMSGTHVIVGSGDEQQFWSTGPGAVFVYDLMAADPTLPELSLSPPMTPGGGTYGFSVASSGDQIIVSDPNYDDQTYNDGNAYVYRLTAPEPSVPQATLASGTTRASTARFGLTSAVTEDYLLVGAFLEYAADTNRGTVYAYDLSSPDTSEPLVKLSNPLPEVDVNFGSELAASGSLVVVGATRFHENAFVFDLESADPTTPIHILSSPGESGDTFGSSVAVEGSRVAVGAGSDDTAGFNTGAVYVYDLASDTPEIPVATLINPDPSVNERFGAEVTISGDYLVATSFVDDKVFVYDLGLPNPEQPIASLQTPRTAGMSIDIAGDTVVVSAPQDDTDGELTGSVWLYNLSAADPSIPAYTLTVPLPASERHLFGGKVAISDRWVTATGSGQQQGSDQQVSYVFLYDLNASDPSVATVSIPNPQNGLASFGSSPALSSDRLYVGSSNSHLQNYRQGALYVFSLDDQPSVVGRQLFYNDSTFDGSDPTANQLDDLAIANDKTPLLPGGQATETNFSNFANGINGVMVDLAGVVDPESISAADFSFRVGNENNLENWTEAPAPSSIAHRQLAAGVSRISLVWPNQAIKGTWLEVTIKATPQTGLAADDRFYFGNSPGDVSGDAMANATDFMAIRANPRNFLNPALVDDAYDLNRDGRVNTTDLLLVREQATELGAALQLLSLPNSFAATADLLFEKHRDREYAWPEPTRSARELFADQHTPLNNSSPDTSAPPLDSQQQMLDRLMSQVPESREHSGIPGLQQMEAKEEEFLEDLFTGFDSGVRSSPNTVQFSVMPGVRDVGFQPSCRSKQCDIVKP